MEKPGFWAEQVAEKTLGLTLAVRLLWRGSLDCRNIMFKAELHRWEIGSPEKEHKLSKAIQEHVWQRKVKHLI